MARAMSNKAARTVPAPLFSRTFRDPLSVSTTEAMGLTIDNISSSAALELAVLPLMVRSIRFSVSRIAPDIAVLARPGDNRSCREKPRNVPRIADKRWPTSSLNLCWDASMRWRLELVNSSSSFTPSDLVSPACTSGNSLLSIAESTLDWNWRVNSLEWRLARTGCSLEEVQTHRPSLEITTLRAARRPEILSRSSLTLSRSVKAHRTFGNADLVLPTRESRERLPSYIVVILSK